MSPEETAAAKQAVEAIRASGGPQTIQAQHLCNAVDALTAAEKEIARLERESVAIPPVEDWPDDATGVYVDMGYYPSTNAVPAGPCEN